MAKTPKRPRDPNQLARMIVDLATGDAADPALTAESQRAEAGRKGGLTGGAARAALLTKEQRVEIARNAANSRHSRKTR